MVSFINIDRYQYARISDNICSVFKSMNAETCSNSMERCVTAKIRNDINFVFDLSTFENGLVKIKAFFAKPDIISGCESCIADYICQKNCSESNGYFYGYDQKAKYLTITTVERLEPFLEQDNIRNAVDKVFKAAGRLRFNDVIFEEHSDEEYCDEDYGDER